MLSLVERQTMDTLNSDRQWGITYDEFNRLVLDYETARNCGDTHRMELIEYRLTDINFHSEVRLLKGGMYQDALISTWTEYT